MQKGVNIFLPSAMTLGIPVDANLNIPQKNGSVQFRKMEADFAARKRVAAKWHPRDALDCGGAYRTETGEAVPALVGKNEKTSREHLFFVTAAPFGGRESVIKFKKDPFF